MRRNRKRAGARPGRSRNPVAAGLASRQYRTRVVINAKAYSRKVKHRSRDGDQPPGSFLGSLGKPELLKVPGGHHRARKRKLAQ